MTDDPALTGPDDDASPGDDAAPAADGGASGDGGGPAPGQDSGAPAAADAGKKTTGDAATPNDASALTTRPSAGELLVTEIMYDPSGTEPDQEWIEVYNAASSARLLSGLVLKDSGQRTHTIDGTQAVVVAPGAYALLVRDKAAATAAKVPAASILYEYGAGIASTDGILLTNGTTGSIAILDGTTEIASVAYGGWFTQASPGGHSVQQKSTASQASTATGWCLSPQAWATGADMGTPGAASDCP